MPRLAPRARYALVLLTAALGPAAGPRASIVPASPPVRTASTAPAADSSPAQVVLIPCISGMCQVPLNGTPALIPLRPGPPSPANAAAPYALAAGRPSEP
jgi:hypothetical protein